MTSRRTFLKAGAATAGVVAFPSLLSATPALGVGTVPELLANDTFPIGFFWPPPAKEITTERYAEIANAGFTFVNSGNGVYNWDLSRKLLDACEANGLAALPSDDRIGNATICPGWQDTVRRVRDEYAAYSPAFKGFRLADEPSPVHYPRYRMIADVLAQAGPTDLTHVNLVPLYDARRGPVYVDFLNRYLDQFAPTFVSFDHYPLLDTNKVRDTYFLNWSLIRAAGLRANLPTWTYIQSVDHWNLKRPTKEELQWQMSMSLAYGCKGVQYFTYWTPVGRPDFEFGMALIDKTTLKPSPLYRFAQEINTHWLRPYGRELKHLASESVVHGNESPPPLGAIPFSTSPQLRSVSGDPVVLGQFRTTGDDDGRRWLFVANRWYTPGDNATATVTVQPGIGLVEEYTPVSGGEFGQYTPVPVSTAGAFSTTVLPGSGRLYRLTPAAPPGP